MYTIYCSTQYAAAVLFLVVQARGTTTPLHPTGSKNSWFYFRFLPSLVVPDEEKVEVGVGPSSSRLHI